MHGIKDDKVLDIARIALRTCYLTRIIDIKMTTLAKQNKGGNFHLSANGHELIGAVAGFYFKDNWGFPYYRDRAFVIGKGAEITDLFSSFLARDTPLHSGGMMMGEHYSSRKLKLPCQSSVVGSQLMQGVGLALGLKLRKTKDVVYVSCGDGATSQGDFHEALNFAALHQCPIVFVVQDNGWAISVSKEEQTCNDSVADYGKGYKGLVTDKLDGGDFYELNTSFRRAKERALEGLGPTLIVAECRRLSSHSISDNQEKYKSKDLCANEAQFDPTKNLEDYLYKSGGFSKKELAELRIKIKNECDRAAKQAEQVSFPLVDRLEGYLFKQGDEHPESLNEISDEKIVMVDALNRAHHEMMLNDADIIVFGQDVAGGKGGVFGVTSELTDKFGKDRCFNTPLGESTIMGLALGLSLLGFKPIAEIQFADYIWTGVNQLFNEISSLAFRSKGEWNLPLVIRMPCGGYIQGGPYHSQNIEGVLAHIPGLKVVLPSNAADAKRLLKAAVLDPNPVIFLEHKGLYRQFAFAARSEPDRNDMVPLGKAKIIKEGRDITVITYGMMTSMAYEVIESMTDISVELIDLRTIVPLDKQTILDSVKKTSRSLILQEAQGFAGFASELTSIITEEAFEYLDAPVMRATSKHLPVPFGKNLEEAVLIDKGTIREAIHRLISY